MDAAVDNEDDFPDILSDSGDESEAAVTAAQLMAALPSAQRNRLRRLEQKLDGASRRARVWMRDGRSGMPSSAMFDDFVVDVSDRTTVEQLYIALQQRAPVDSSSLALVMAGRELLCGGTLGELPRQDWPRPYAGSVWVVQKRQLPQSPRHGLGGKARAAGP